MKRILFFVVAIFLLSSTVINTVQASPNGGKGINEKLGVPIVVYGETLTDDQEEEVRNQLNVENRDAVDEYSVNGQDIANYIGGNPNSRMYSSVKITPEEEGSGLNVNIITPDNITQVTKEMYKNALLTAGVTDATVDVASPVQVSGHSALTGIYKAYDVNGAKLDSDRMKVASEELDVATKLAEEAGIDKEKVSQLISEIKKEIAKQNPVTREEVEQIVKDQLDSLNINLNPQDVERLTNLFDQIRKLNINFDDVQKQLEDIAASAKDLLNDEGFWNSIASFFERILTAISELIQSLLNAIRSIFA